MESAFIRVREERERASIVAGFEEIVVSDDERCNVGIASLEKVSDSLNTGVDRTHDISSLQS
jgi:hypothetical protein